MTAARQKDMVNSECWHSVTSMMEFFVPLYTQIFYVPIEFEMESDGIRKVDTGYQKEIDYYMSEELLRHKNVTIVKGSRDERKNIVLKYLHELIHS